MNIYQISKEYRDIISQIIEQGGELTEADEKALASMDGALEIKAENYCRIIRELEGQMSVYKSEIERLTALKRSSEATLNNLKSRLLNAMIATGREKINTELFKLSIRRDKQTITDDSILPKKYFRVKIVKEPDKRLIGGLLKEGKKIKGASLATSLSLTIN